MGTSQVFLVHGHDSRMRKRVEEWLREIGLEPIILHQQPDQGRTIIEKIEAYSGVGSAIILLSSDDEGRRKPAKKKREKLRPRARQNVILELGYFIGKLGRDKVHALYREQKESRFELPSDIMGVLYTPFKRAEDWQSKLIRELEAAGCPIKKVSRATRRRPIAMPSSHTTPFNKPLDQIELVSLLITSKWILYYNPPHGKKTVGFRMDFSVGDGRNQNEHEWRVNNGKLEFYNIQGRLFSRFVLDGSRTRWTHTNDADTLSKNQYMVKAG
jgi:hypothetical protein